MAFYNEDLIDDIKNSNDIVEVIGSYINFKKNGRNYIGLCPFHSEKTPSFVVSPDKQIFHCFGCNSGGNVISFVKKIENIDFKEAIELLAERARITLPENQYSVDDRKQKLKEKIYQINKATAIFYHENLYNPKSTIAQQYIKKRKLGNNTLKAFLIGYSGSFDELYRHLKSKGFTDEEILASNLVNRNEKGIFIDRFRKRLMIPICDVRDRIIAFGGRVLDDSLPKYINSPEGIVYSKGRNLFGLNVAKRNDLNKVVIVEGYMDAISLYQRGITNVVASLGTALTENQGRLLKKYSKEIIISYDSDGAGQAATLRGLDILSSLGANVRVLQMEDAKDPDEYIIKFGSARFQKLIDNAISLVEFKIRALKKQYNLNNDSEKIEFLTKMAQIISKVENTIEQEVYIENISNEYNISKEAIYGQINKNKYKPLVNRKILERPKVVAARKEEDNLDEKTLKRERMIIYLLLEYPKESFEKIKNNINLQAIKLDMHKEILKRIYEFLDKGNFEKSNLIDLFIESEEQMNYITGILSQESILTDVDKAVTDIINIALKEELSQRKIQIINRLDEEISEEEKADLERQLNEIIIKLKK